jgi:hypothetical protein
MNEIAFCPECGVPGHITGEHLWLNNGDIVQKRDLRNRIVFFEGENIDPLLSNIEEIIGTPIAHIVITAVRRAVRAYVTRMVPEDVRAAIRSKELDPIPIALAMMDVGKMMGYGGQELVGYQHEGREDDYYTVKILEPFSVPIVCGTAVGAVEAVLGGDRGFTYRKEGPGKYEVNVFPSPHPEELERRMRPEAYDHRDGGIELERCAGCGGPAALSSYRWDMGRGVCVNKESGRRMVMIGPQELDLIFAELEQELGEAISEVVVEAQRRFTRSGFYSLDDVGSEAEFRDLLAVQGLGNMQGIQVNRERLRMRLENAALPLMLVGIMQGVYENALDVDSRVEWELSQEGDLEIEIRPV